MPAATRLPTPAPHVPADDDAPLATPSPREARGAGLPVEALAVVRALRRGAQLKSRDVVGYGRVWQLERLDQPSDVASLAWETLPRPIGELLFDRGYLYRVADFGADAVWGLVAGRDGVAVGEGC